jgi:hypothetical protein
MSNPVRFGNHNGLMVQNARLQSISSARPLRD